MFRDGWPPGLVGWSMNRWRCDKNTDPFALEIPFDTKRGKRTVDGRPDETVCVLV